MVKKFVIFQTLDLLDLCEQAGRVYDVVADHNSSAA